MGARPQARQAVSAPSAAGRGSPRFLVVVALFIAALLTANVIAVKLFAVGVTLPGLGPLVLPAAIVVFPLSYLLGDVLTEVYGYRTARLVIWLGFLANGVLVAFVWVGLVLPPAGFWDAQPAYERVLGFTWRLLVASFAAYLVGEFANAYVLARMKVATRGRWLWSRTIGSTVVGQGLDSLVFITIAFAGQVPTLLALGQLVVVQWWAKVLYEVLATPLTYLVVGYLKRAEGVDAYDRGVDFNPLALAR